MALALSVKVQLYIYYKCDAHIEMCVSRPFRRSFRTFVLIVSEFGQREFRLAGITSEMVCGRGQVGGGEPALKVYGP